jgi:carbamoyl-phosphate synthase large subunit
VNKVLEGSPHIVDRVHAGEVTLVFNTTAGKKEIADSFSIRRESLLKGVAHFTTLEAARMIVGALEAQATSKREYKPIQEWLKPR